MSQRRLALTAAHLPELGSVLRSSRDGDRWQLYAADSDAVVCELVGRDVDFRDLEVAPASLEEAFLALTATPLTRKVPA